MINQNIFNNIDADLNHINQLYPDFNFPNRSDYYNSAKINEVYCRNEEDFSVYHLNICSLYPKFDEILGELSLLTFNFDILCFTETWLTDESKGLLAIDNYNSYHTIRRDRRGGGVTAFISTKFKSNIIEPISVVTPHVESLCIELMMGAVNILCCVIYLDLLVEIVNYFMILFIQFLIWSTFGNIMK